MIPVRFRPSTLEEARELIRRYGLRARAGRPGAFRFPVCRGGLACLHPVHRRRGWGAVRVVHSAELLLPERDRLERYADPFLAWREALARPLPAQGVPSLASMFDRAPAFPAPPAWK